MTRMRTKAGEKGFALMDAVIAAAIAAGATVAAAQALGVAARSAKSAQALNAVISEAEIIAARLDAGLSGDELTEGLNGWTVIVAPYSFGDRRPGETEARPLRILATHETNPAFSFERIVIAEGGS